MRFLYGYSLRGYSLYSYFLSCMPLAAFFIFLNRGFGTFCTDFSVRGAYFRHSELFSPCVRFIYSRIFIKTSICHFGTFFPDAIVRNFSILSLSILASLGLSFFLRSFYRHFLKSATFFRNFFQSGLKVHPDYTCTVPTHWSELCSLYPNHSLIII